MSSESPASNTKLVVSLLAIVAGMVMLTFAAVPLYSLFCQVTGLGGTTQVADAPAQSNVIDQKITVRFNTDIMSDLPWEFEALTPKFTLNIGAEELAIFTAENTSTEPLNGVAIYNVTPHAAAPYFNKIQCFCFDDMRLQAGEKANLPVSFFIDPEITQDPYLKDLKTVTLSYTFFKSKNQEDAVPAPTGTDSE